MNVGLAASGMAFGLPELLPFPPFTAGLPRTNCGTLRPLQGHPVGLLLVGPGGPPRILRVATAQSGVRDAGAQIAILPPRRLSAPAKQSAGHDAKGRGSDKPPPINGGHLS